MDSLASYRSELDSIKRQGLFKTEYEIETPQRVVIRTRQKGEVLNFCANNYLGLADHPEVIAAAHQALDEHGFGLASVRFICGTQDLHKELEETISKYLGTEDTILYPSCFDANGGLFETILGPEDAVISDQLNHASIIDGIRLCKAERHRYPHADMEALEDALRKTRNKRFRLIATDGVFSMDGYIAKLEDITSLAKQYDAMVMIDDCHATGFLGATGRGSAEHCGVMDKVDIFTSTLGKALGGGTGGFTAARGEIVELLRQRSRPYLFSNTLAPPIVGASIKVFELLENGADLRGKLMHNATEFRRRIQEVGFEIKAGSHPIVPVMLHDADKAQRMATALIDEGIYAIAFFYPVVPEGEARIRVQLSAKHEPEHIDAAIEAFRRAGERTGVLAS